jgi:flagellar hook-length control protein FliK
VLQGQGSEAAAWRQYAAGEARVQGQQVRQAAGELARHFQEELVEHAHLARGRGRSQLTVQLDPPQLGRVRLEIVSEDGSLDVSIAVENAGLREALRGELHQLDRGLRQMHPDGGRTDVSDFGSSAGGGQRRGADEPGPALMALPLLGASTTEQDAPRTWTLLGAQRELDCFV